MHLFSEAHPKLSFRQESLFPKKRNVLMASIVTADIKDPNASLIDLNASPVPLSKNALKRLQKKALWESKAEDRKNHRKEKRSAKRQERRALKASGLLPLKSPDSIPQPDPVPSGSGLVIDLQFQNKMTDKVYLLNDLFDACV